jgi:double-strand break repair protein MRE11
VATDNHVGYAERDPIRGDDSWKSFDEVMSVAKERDVDMVLLAGDLFHENKPSRKSMYQVMRSLRTNCLGDKPCELQMLSDGSEHFAGAFNHVNYEDQDLNVAIPVFSIHGNHDDPSGEGHLAALDLLSMSGLVNYYGRTPESDNIHVKPVLLQKGNTKLALYGMSNVRDERLWRTFRDGNVKFFRPSAQTGEWFNIMSVHQNHHAYTETSYLPENFLPNYMDLVIWGHEHECKIQPETNAEMGFKVMQPGSSVATSLVKGEAEPKHIAIVSVTGLEHHVEPIRLKTVRPFLTREITMRDFKQLRDLAHVRDNKTKITSFLMTVVEELIAEAQQEWNELHQNSDEDEEEEAPLPLIRLRVETTAPDGGKFDVENPQRFSNRFQGRVANASDIVQFHKKRAVVRSGKMQPDMPEDGVIKALQQEDTIKVDELVAEFLKAQALTILPQNSFSDAVGQFVNKDDKHAMEEFLGDSLKTQQENLLATARAAAEDDEDDNENADELDDDAMADLIEKNRLVMEAEHDRGERRLRRKRGALKPKPPNWDSDMDGAWEDSLMSVAVEEGEEEGAEEEDDETPTRAARGRGARGGRGGKTAAGTTRKTAAAPKKAPAKKAPAKAPAARGRKKQTYEEDDEDEDGDAIMISDDDDDDEEEESQGLFVSQAKQAPAAKKPAPRATRGRGGAAAGRGTQATLNFGSSQATSTARSSTMRSTTRPQPSRRMEPEDDEISDDDDAFEPPPAAQRTSRR